MSGVAVGDPAPAFKLAGTGGHDYSLEEYRGQTVVLVFYPGDNTPVCTKQLCSYTHDMDQFSDLGSVVLGISPQDVASHERFSASKGLSLPLLADTDKAVGQAYGILGPVGFYRRSVFVIDRVGTIRYAHRSMAGLTYRPTAELVAAIRAAQASV
ncbi:MAG: peroxiredoxin, partial [Acidimicrobiales bacterium]